MFKHGMYVRGKPNNGYGITTNMSIVKVVRIHSDSTFSGEVVAHKETSSYVGNRYERLVCDLFVTATKSDLLYFRLSPLLASKNKVTRSWVLK